ncbi:hypothetical protein [Pelolinea submarina]|uniref:Apea-like HEPN domain-containing protein n=1 Tax=Pelolinea submarina TaxID=913107 RepID=A0A347ZPB3_9CHLR|nr:hypothetical protein [Pelolinea submarina]REG08745.1 hypothetical protein DFR64_2120 [Pelolinea submarina]BBB47144.1 hypothetical protein Pelsub_P0371 [Pelolinea submarina]
MKFRPVYNLEFPSWCPELNIVGYRFLRVDDYQQKLQNLQHVISYSSEFAIKKNTGTHSLTAFVEIPKNEEKAIFNWSGRDNIALMDVLLLLTLFTGRDVFTLGPQTDKQIIRTSDVIIADPRVFDWGGTLRCSIPYKKQTIDPEPYGYDIGFEEGLNKIYKLISSNDWQKKYKGGYFLLLAKSAFKHQILESAFIQCWTIWEHLFAILNSQWLSGKKIQQIGSADKISFLLVEFALTGDIDTASRKRIETLTEIRNRLIHFGRFPERSSSYNDAVLFIRLTEFILSKILGLSPSNVFNTVNNLERFLRNE